MPLHLGEDRAVRVGRVVAILDHELFRRAGPNASLLSLARSAGRLDACDGAVAESVVLTDREVILSPLSRKALARRAGAGPLPGATGAGINAHAIRGAGGASPGVRGVRAAGAGVRRRRRRAGKSPAR